MKSANLTTGIFYGVVASWKYSSKTARDPMSTTRNHVLKAEIVNMTKYAYEIYRSASETDPVFRPAPAGDRKFGYLVTDGSMYWVARPADIVDLWVSLEKRWAAAEAAQAAAMSEIRKREDLERQLMSDAEAYKERMQRTLSPLIAQLTGKTYPIVFSISQYSMDSRERTNPFIIAQMDVRMLERLIESVFEAQEA